MPVRPETCRPFLHGDFARAVERRRRSRARAGRVVVAAAALFVLLLLCAIPAYLLASAASLPFADRSPDWARLGVLFSGSLRATLCALVFAVPVGIGAALFAAHFCAPRLRGWLRSALELLEAVPTVVLGLIAFASIAPWLARHVAGVLAALAIVPCALLAWGFAIRLPRRRLGWMPLWGVPVLAAACAAGMLAGAGMGDGRFLPTSPWNALLVGLVLGIATLPTIYAMAEDALASLPAAQTQAALALGATRWQALMTIALPAVASGLVAATCMAAARCFGETMIVLMASGNTPLSGFDWLGGLRSLSAELALELPRSAPASPAWRELLLVALLLLATTMLLHGIARALRTRLRAGQGA